MKDKRILVTGATGLIGSSIAKRLLREGNDVFALSRDLEKNKAVFSSEKDADRLVFLSGNVQDGFPEDAGELDFIIHAAGPVSGRQIREYPADVLRAHAVGVERCLEYLRKQGFGTMIVLSSATVYGAVNGDEDMKVSEGERGSIRDEGAYYYALSKVMAEALADAYFRQYAVRSVTARIGYVYGPVGRSSEGAFAQFVRAALKGEDIEIKSTEMARRDYIHVDDVVSGLITVMEQGKAGEIYNISSGGDGGQYVSLHHIAKELAGLSSVSSGKRISVKPDSIRETPGIIMDNSKLKSLGWSVSLDLEKGLKSVLERSVC